jgi:hypothetical protein
MYIAMPARRVSWRSFNDEQDENAITMTLSTMVKLPQSHNHCGMLFEC